MRDKKFNFSVFYFLWGDLVGVSVDFERVRVIREGETRFLERKLCKELSICGSRFVGLI